jgi:hypothetical protein
VRRLSHIPFISLYKRKCDFCGSDFVSNYSPDKPYVVYCNPCWRSDKWDPMEYGIDYDFSRPFFQQYKELLLRMPLPGIHTDYPTFSVNAAYNNLAGHMKNCYMLVQAGNVENCGYGYLVVDSKDCFNSFLIDECEFSSELLHCWKVYGGIELGFTTQTSNSAFLWQCDNCQDCFASANLKHKQYHIFNKPYSKEEYLEKIKEYDLGSCENYLRIKRDMREYRLKYPIKTFWNEFSTDTNGLFVFSSKRCKDCFETNGAEDSRWLTFIEDAPVRDSYDYSGWGEGAELMYECAMVGRGTCNIKFSASSGYQAKNMQYSIMCDSNISDLFGCFGLRNKKYCILNKQYTQEEYEVFLPKIINQMNEMPYTDVKNRKYCYGEFFPVELSTIAYNESYAYQYFPLNREEALDKGFAWKDAEDNRHKITTSAADLPNHIRDAGDSILQEIIGCVDCGKGYRLIPQELELSRRINIPIPRQCFFCRLREKMQDQPNPFRMHRRKCQCAGKSSLNGVYENQFEHSHGSSLCQNGFETSYSLDRPEIVYCKECYQAEIV